MPLIDIGEAINIAANNETIKEFLSRKFIAPNRRSVQVALVQNSTYTITKPSEDRADCLSGAPIDLQTSVSRLPSGRSI